MTLPARGRRGGARWLAPVAAALALGGCATYTPRPITREGVEEGLAVPPAEEIRVMAASIRHPLLPPVAVDQSDGLSPDEAAVLAVLLNPSLRATRDERALADAQLLEAGVLPNPEFSASREPVIGGETEGTVTGSGTELGWDLDALASRRARVAGAEADRARVDLGVAWREWQVAQAARLAVYTLVAAREREALARERSDRLDDRLARVRRAVESGSMTGPDLAVAEDAAARARSGLLDARGEVRRHGLALDEALGLPAGTDVRLQPGIELPSGARVPSGEDLLDGLEDRRLDLVALRRGYDSQEAAVRAAILDQFPRIRIGIGRARDPENVLTLPLSVSVELPVFDRNRAAIARERATRRRLYDEYVSRVFEARSEIAALRASAGSLAEELRAAEAPVPSLSGTLRAYRRAVDEGRADVLGYDSAWDDLAARRIGIVALRRRLVETLVALEIAAGAYDLGALRSDAPAGRPGPDGEAPTSREGR